MIYCASMIPNSNYQNSSNYKKSYTKQAPETSFSSISLPITEHQYVRHQCLKLTVGKLNELHAQAEPRINEWNVELARRVDLFGREHEDSSVFLFDANSVFKKVLDNPRDYDFLDADQACVTRQCMWTDKIHPSSPMHKILAEDLARFLNTL